MSSTNAQVYQTASTSHIEVDGISFGYRYLKPTIITSSLPLLMFYHFRSSMDTWDPLVINTLLKSRPVILFDHAGHGHSSGEIKLSIKDMTSDAIAFISALQTSSILKEEKIDVLGFSMGGFIAQQFTINAPQLVNRLVLAGTSASSGAGIQDAAISVLATISGVPEDKNAVINTMFTPLNFTAGQVWYQRSRERKSLKPGNEEFHDWLSDAGEIGRLSMAYASWGIDPVPFAFLPTITKEVLVVAGQNDVIIPTVNAFVLSQRLPRGLLHIFPDSSHGFLFQYPEKFVGLVDGFLDGRLL